eukprot:m.146369 g.146369  ORF g.146369 m.146369 type:complete len:648 (+) comp10091_c0_seq1:1634-3577(+)
MSLMEHSASQRSTPTQQRGDASTPTPSSIGTPRRRSSMHPTLPAALAAAGFVAANSASSDDGDGDGTASPAANTPQPPDGLDNTSKVVMRSKRASESNYHRSSGSGHSNGNGHVAADDGSGDDAESDSEGRGPLARGSRLSVVCDLFGEFLPRDADLDTVSLSSRASSPPFGSSRHGSVRRRSSAASIAAPRPVVATRESQASISEQLQRERATTAGSAVPSLTSSSASTAAAAFAKAKAAAADHSAPSTDARKPPAPQTQASNHSLGPSAAERVTSPSVSRSSTQSHIPLATSRSPYSNPPSRQSSSESMVRTVLSHMPAHGAAPTAPSTSSGESHRDSPVPLVSSSSAAITRVQRISNLAATGSSDDGASSDFSASSPSPGRRALQRSLTSEQIANIDELHDTFRKRAMSARKLVETKVEQKTPPRRKSQANSLAQRKSSPAPAASASSSSPRRSSTATTSRLRQENPRSPRKSSGSPATSSSAGSTRTTSPANRGRRMSLPQNALRQSSSPALHQRSSGSSGADGDAQALLRSYKAQNGVLKQQIEDLQEQVKKLEQRCADLQAVANQQAELREFAELELSFATEAPTPALARRVSREDALMARLEALEKANEALRAELAETRDALSASSPARRPTVDLDSSQV